MNTINNSKFNWQRIAAIAIALFSVTLSLVLLGKEGNSNIYYASAVKSMMMNFHNFFFIALDPAGWISIDKPPLGLWLEVLSCKLFGFNTYSMILPNALAAGGTVYLLYCMVSKAWNKNGALLACMICATTPALVAVSRTNNLDAMLLFFVTLSAYFALKSVRNQKFFYFLWSMVALGAGFNVKMIQAYLVLPAVYLVFFLGYQASFGKKILKMLAATAVLLAVSFSWMTAVTLTPASNRPFIGSSTNNSVFELMTGHNGYLRLFGRTSGTNGTAPKSFTMQTTSGTVTVSSNGTATDSTTSSANQTNANAATQNAPGTPPTGKAPTGTPPSGAPGGSIKGGAMPSGGGMAGTGTVGALRLFGSDLSGQAAWFLFPALLGVLIAIYAFIKKCRKKLDENEFTIERYLQQIFWAAWLLPMVVFFSVAGFFHPYYLTILAPALGALTISVVSFIKVKTKKHNKVKFALPIIFVATLAIQMIFVSSTVWASTLNLILAICGGISIAVWVISQFKNQKFIKNITAIVMALSLLIAPGAWCSTAVLYNLNTTIPVAGPSLVSSESHAMGGIGSKTDTTLISYLQSNNSKSVKYIVAVQSADTAASIILSTGSSVLCYGGFEGNDPTLTVSSLKALVKSGNLRYFMVGGQGGASATSDVITWVEANGKSVNYNSSSSSNSFGNASQGAMNGGTLYDLAGASS